MSQTEKRLKRIENVAGEIISCVEFPADGTEILREYIAQVRAEERQKTIEECANKIAGLERERWKSVGNPMVPEFTPYWANQLRALKGGS